MKPHVKGPRLSATCGSMERFNSIMRTSGSGKIAVAMLSCHAQLSKNRGCFVKLSFFMLLLCFGMLSIPNCLASNLCDKLNCFDRREKTVCNNESNMTRRVSEEGPLQEAYCIRLVHSCLTYLSGQKKALYPTNFTICIRVRNRALEGKSRDHPGT